jgi:hypothetical protein
LRGLPPASSLDTIEEVSQFQVPFPQYRVTLGEDGTVPESLCVQIDPTRSLANEESESVDPELASLLGGLLDVRIPERLGSMHQFEAFSEHAAFVDYGYGTTVHLRTSISPLVKQDWCEVLSNEIRNRSFRAPSSAPEAPLVLGPDIDSELDRLFFVQSSPSDSELTLNLNGLPLSPNFGPNKTQSSVFTPGRSLSRYY